MPWELTTDRAIYVQLMDHIQQDIISGFYKPGDKLPSVRDLAAEANVNPNTMQKALTELERTGLIYTNRTSGKYITEDISMISSRKNALAKEKLLKFLDQMKQLGFLKEELISLLQKTAQELSE